MVPKLPTDIIGLLNTYKRTIHSSTTGNNNNKYVTGDLSNERIPPHSFSGIEWASSRHHGVLLVDMGQCLAE